MYNFNKIANIETSKQKNQLFFKNPFFKKDDMYKIIIFI
jgi:hypothetical protein